MTGEDKLRAAVGRLGRGGGREGKEVDQRPGSVYGPITREGMDDLRDSLAEVRDEIKWLRRWLAAIFLAVVAEAVLRQFGLRRGQTGARAIAL